MFGCESKHTYSLLSLHSGMQQGLQSLTVQAVSFSEIVNVQLVLHSLLAICNAEEVPLCVTTCAAVRGQPQLIL